MVKTVRTLSGVLCMLLCVALAVSCGGRQSGKDGTADSFVRFYRSISDSLSNNPGYVYEQSLLQMAETEDSMEYYQYMVLLAKAYMFKSDIDSASVCMDRAERFCRSVPSTSEVYSLYSDIYNMRGNLLSRRGLVDSASVCFSTALAHCLKGNRAEAAPDISLNLADACVRQGKYDKGALWYRKALTLFDSLGVEEKFRFPAYYGLAQVYMELRDFEQCDRYYDMAAQWYDDMLPFEKCIYLNNRGNSFYFRRDYPRALEMFRRELALARSYPDMVFEEKLSEMNMGEVFLLMGRTDSAAHYLNRSQGFFRSIGNVSAIYYIDTQLIALALKENNLPLARKRIAEAVKPEYVEPNMRHIRNRNLQHYFAEAGDYKQAYHFLLENQRIDDSTRNERIKMRTAEIDLKYRQDTTLMKQKIFIQQKENEVLELNQRMYIWMFACFCVIVLVVFLYFYKENQRSLLRMRSRNTIAALRMENIRNRVSPHFVFNVLNQEMGSNAGGSENMTRMVKLIRRNLELAEKFCVTLEEELDFVQTYIDLERRSLGDSFILSVHIDEGIDVSREVLPSMMIQIPVENAIKHALRGKEGERRLWIDIRRDNTGALCIRITDNGGGYKAASIHRGTGTGMKVILQTIQMLNANNRHHIGVAVNNVTLENGEQGCEYAITLPKGYDYELKRTV